VVEYEPDSELRDTEQIPLQEEGGIEGFLRREVLPYAPDAWVVRESVGMGYCARTHGRLAVALEGPHQGQQGHPSGGAGH